MRRVGSAYILGCDDEAMVLLKDFRTEVVVSDAVSAEAKTDGGVARDTHRWYPGTTYEQQGYRLRNGKDGKRGSLVCDRSI
jgi:hypothetical protein